MLQFGKFKNNKFYYLENNILQFEKWLNCANNFWIMKK